MALALSACQRRYQGLKGSADVHPVRVGIAAIDRRLASFRFSIRTATAALLALLLIVGIGLFLHKRPSATLNPNEVSASRKSHETPVIVAPAAPGPPPGESTISTEQPSSAAPLARPKAMPAQRRSAQATAARARQASDPNASRCKPPYYFNAQGSRVFKIECL